MENLFHRFR
ncbi:hypothetical protein CP8484711_1444, partial [Chlamydia psittaci 84-8471/1]